MKTKKIPKTKEQILSDIKKNQKFQEKMKFAKEIFFPALCDATNSVDEATQHLSIINSIIMEKFLGLMKEKKMSELKIIDSLSEKDPKYEEMKKMISLFDDFTVFDAKDQFEGMKNEITLFQTEEMKSRPLSSLKCTWIDELK